MEKISSVTHHLDELHEQVLVMSERASEVQNKFLHQQENGCR